MNSRKTKTNPRKTSKKTKSKNNFDNLKSNFILKKIFDLMKENKKLKIINYNKTLQKRLNLTLNTYKEYYQNHSPIEIELKPVKDTYGLFISIPEENEEYYHIYFDDSKKEIKRNSLEKNEKVKKIKIIIDYPVESFEFLFAYSKCINSIFFKKFTRNNITNMSNMFYKCSALKELNLSNYNTNNVIDMSNMFSECSLLIKLNLSSFNTHKVTNMCGMFSGCNSLKELNVSSFNTNNVTDMSNMFGCCRGLTKLNLSNFNTDNVISMKYMFSLCFELNELNLSNFKTKKETNVEGMFLGCSNELIDKIKKQIKNINIE